LKTQSSEDIPTLKPKLSSKKGSLSLFSPRSPSLAGEVVPICGSTSFQGEAPPSSRSLQNN
jgi:hypothetical protein